jgi:hypothetical protein
MILEIGKKYVCRNIPDIKYVVIVDKNGLYKGDIHYQNQKYSTDSAYFYQDGRLQSYRQDPMDLITEYKEERVTCL